MMRACHDYYLLMMPLLLMMIHYAMLIAMMPPLLRYDAITLFRDAAADADADSAMRLLFDTFIII